MFLETAIILAGGLGTRLRSVIKNIPKPMAPVDGRPFLEYQLDYLLNQGLRRVVLSVGYRHEVIQAHFGYRYKELTVEYAIEPSPMGTGGAVILASQNLDLVHPVLVLNGDTWFPVSVTELVEMYERHRAGLVMALRQVVSNERYGGIVLDDTQRIVNFLTPDQGVSQWINGGVYLMAPETLQLWQKYGAVQLSLEADLFAKGEVAREGMWGYASDAPFLDIGVPEDYARADSMLRRKEL